MTQPSAADALRRNKDRLRREMRSRLALVTAEDARSAGHAVAERLVGLTSWVDAGRIALFASRADEIDMAPTFDRSRRAGKQVVLPRVGEGEVLELRVVDDLRALVVGRFGLREPSLEAPRIELGVGDLVVVPGLAFDRLGGRLGRGRGYYDRLLFALGRDPEAPVSVGVGFTFQLVERVPMGERDAAVDSVVTEGEAIEWTGARRQPSVGRDEERRARGRAEETEAR